MRIDWGERATLDSFAAGAGVDCLEWSSKMSKTRVKKHVLPLLTMVLLMGVSWNISKIILKL